MALDASRRELVAPWVDFPDDWTMQIGDRVTVVIARGKARILPRVEISADAYPELDGDTVRFGDSEALVDSIYVRRFLESELERDPPRRLRGMMVENIKTPEMRLFGFGPGLT